jgi:hypothetical protein
MPGPSATTRAHGPRGCYLDVSQLLLVRGPVGSLIEQMLAVPRLAKDPAASDLAATFEEMRQ